MSMRNKPPHEATRGKTVSYSQPPLVLATHEAIVRTLSADKELFARLPVPVRYRATGAVRAWQDALAQAGPAGALFREALADPNCGPQDLQSPLIDFMLANAALDFRTAEGERVLHQCINSVYWQAFWTRHGALYEPTAAMQSLLGVTDLAQDIPLRMIRPPVATMCIVPPPGEWTSPQGFEAVALFSHASTQTEGSGPRRRLSLIAQKQQWRAVVDFEIDDASDQTVSQALDGKQSRFVVHRGSSAGNALEDQHRLRHLLDYTIKVLLYLSLDNAQCLPERSYSKAPQTFPGLGRRKRELRIAEVEQLYDRYIVGPQALAAELSGHADGVSGHSVSAHWRRGHFRLQPHGPKASLRKVMFIMPVLVRADRLAEAGPSSP